MRAHLTWFTMEKRRRNLPNYQTCTIVLRVESPLDFDAEPGPPIPSTSTRAEPNFMYGSVFLNQTKRPSKLNTRTLHKNRRRMGASQRLRH